MDLWIRSQKNYEIIPSLIKVNEIKLGKYEKEIDEVLQPKYTKVYPCLIVNSYFVVGVYEKEERALEVLDEIDSLMSDAVNNGLKVARYEMPKE